LEASGSTSGGLIRPSSLRICVIAERRRQQRRRRSASPPTAFDATHCLTRYAPPPGGALDALVDVAEGGGALVDGGPSLNLATNEQLQLCYAHLCKLFQAIRERHRGQGRYSKVETARRNFIRNVAIPGLSRGKLPSAQDEAFLLAKDKATHGARAELTPAEEKELLSWAGVHNQDPRTLKKAERIKELSEETVQTTLAWAEGNLRYVLKSTKGLAGAPPVYRFGDENDILKQSANGREWGPN
jgi:hypothetical protein